MAILSKGQTFANADSITSTKLNNLVDAATFVAGSSGTTDNASLEVNGSGRLQVKDLGITSSKLATDAVTTGKIANATNATDGVTYAKIQHVAGMRVIGNITGSTAAPSEVSILDEDNMASDSATALATQQSIKAYVESHVASRYVLETSKATTSGTSVDFTGIPSWVKRITLMLNGVSTNGSDDYLVQIGDSGGIENTGYVSQATDRGGDTTSTTGFIIQRQNSSSSTCNGIITISKFSGNSWIESGNATASSNPTASSTGSKTLSDVLTQIRLTTVGGTNAFDAGSINISYE